MSLTRELDNPNSPLSQFLNSHFNQSVVSQIINEHNQKVRRYLPISAPTDSNLPLVGVAMSYAFRWQIQPPQQWFNESNAFRGAYLVDVSPQAILQTVNQAQTSQQQAFCCLIMAALEQACRGHTNPELVYLLKQVSRHQLPFQCPNYAASVTDIEQLSQGFNLGWLNNFKTTEKLYINPTFEGSKDVGDADAQLIVGTRLVDVRSTHKRQPLTRPNFYQQVCYCLLDYSDRYKLTEIVWVYPRQRIFLNYRLNQLLRNLTKLRAELQQFLQQHYLEDTHYRYYLPGNSDDWDW